MQQMGKRGTETSDGDKCDGVSLLPKMMCAFKDCFSTAVGSVGYARSFWGPSIRVQHDVHAIEIESEDPQGFKKTLCPIRINEDSLRHDVV